MILTIRPGFPFPSRIEQITLLADSPTFPQSTPSPRRIPGRHPRRLSNLRPLSSPQVTAATAPSRWPLSAEKGSKSRRHYTYYIALGAHQLLWAPSSAAAEIAGTEGTFRRHLTVGRSISKESAYLRICERRRPSRQLPCPGRREVWQYLGKLGLCLLFVRSRQTGANEHLHRRLTRACLTLLPA